jgi:hypothetical protein
VPVGLPTRDAPASISRLRPDEAAETLDIDYRFGRIPGASHQATGVLAPMA